MHSLSSFLPDEPALSKRETGRGDAQEATDRPDNEQRNASPAAQPSSRRSADERGHTDIANRSSSSKCPACGGLWRGVALSDVDEERSEAGVGGSEALSGQSPPELSVGDG